MRRILAISVLLLTVAPTAFGSIARIDALSRSRHLSDFQTAFDRPYQFLNFGTQAVLEWANRTTNRIELGFLIKDNEQAWGAYLGHRSDFSEALIKEYKSGVFKSSLGTITLKELDHLKEETNPISVYYAGKLGDWALGVTGKLAQGEVETTKSETTSAGISLGVSNGVFSVDYLRGFSGMAKGEINDVLYELESKGMSDITVGYRINNKAEVYVNYASMKADVFDADEEETTEGVNFTRYNLGFVFQVVKTEDTNVFYGVAYESTEKEKLAGAILEKAQVLPVWFGIEKKAYDYLIIRGSMVQNVGLNKNESTLDDGMTVTKSDTEFDSLKMNAGAGIKLGATGMLDLSLTIVDSGIFGFSEKMLTQVSYSYRF